MSDEKLFAMFCICPFVIGASFHFLDLWISLPIAIVVGTFWVGTCMTIAKK